MKRRVVFLGFLLIVSCSKAEARAVPGGDAARGKAVIVATGCGACHVIDGVPGGQGKVGPPLDGIADRSVVGGVLPNTVENIMRWIEDAPSLSPHTAMPNLGLSPAQARDVVAYLYSR
ncbi:MAG TPA: cytochrome c [Gemmatimonadaceae bacterium]|jgi:cytochrome c2